jgi:hypothetical protein
MGSREVDATRETRRLLAKRRGIRRAAEFMLRKLWARERAEYVL